MLDQNSVAQAIANFIHQNQANGVQFSCLFQQASIGNYANPTMQKLVANAMSIVPVVINGSPQLTHNPPALAQEVAVITCRVSGATLVEKAPHLQSQMSPQERADYAANLQLRQQLDYATTPQVQMQHRPTVGYQPQVTGAVQGYQPQAVVPQVGHVPTTSTVANLPASTVHVQALTQAVPMSAPAPVAAAPAVGLDLEHAPRVSTQVASLAYKKRDGLKKVKVWSGHDHKTFEETIIEVPGMKFEDHVTIGTDVLGMQAAFPDAGQKAKVFWDAVLKGKTMRLDALPLNPEDGQIEENDIVVYPEVKTHVSLASALTDFEVQRFEKRDVSPFLQKTVGHFTFRSLQIIHPLGNTEINNSDQTTDKIALINNSQLRPYFNYGQNIDDVDPIEFAAMLAVSQTSSCELERKLAQDINVRMTLAFNNYRKYIVGDNTFEITNFMEDAEVGIERIRAYARAAYGQAWNNHIPITTHMKQLVRRNCNFVLLSGAEAEALAPAVNGSALPAVLENSIWRSHYVTVGVLPLSSVELGIYFDEPVVMVNSTHLPELSDYLGVLCRRETNDLEKLPHRRMFVTNDYHVFEVIAAGKVAETKEPYFAIQSRGQVF